MRSEIRDEKKEEISKIGIINSYKSFFILEKKLSLMGIRRIVYYIFSSLILLSCWYFIEKHNGESLLTSLLNSGGTVLLWEVMSLILIEGKNFKYKVRVNKKLSNIDIIFRYLEDI